MTTKNAPRASKTNSANDDTLITFQPPDSSNTSLTTPFYCLPLDGYSRANQIAKVLGIGVSTWWAWVQSGKAPQPIKLSSTVSIWRNSQVIEFVEAQASNDENYNDDGVA